MIATESCISKFTVSNDIYYLRRTRPGFAGAKAFLTEHGPPDFWLKRNVIVFTAIIANYLKFCGSVFPKCRLLRTAFIAPLRSHHIAAVKSFLLLVREKKDLLALDAC